MPILTCCTKLRYCFSVQPSTFCCCNLEMICIWIKRLFIRIMVGDDLHLNQKIIHSNYGTSICKFYSIFWYVSDLLTWNYNLQWQWQWQYVIAFTGELVKRVTNAHAAPIRNIQASPTQDAFMTCSDDGRSRFWSATEDSEEQLQTYWYQQQQYHVQLWQLHLVNWYAYDLFDIC
jgi:WD40 repeat protein